MESVYVGIDPGANGGIAVIVGADVRAVKMPETDRDVLDYLRGCWDASDGAVVAVLERVSASPQMGVVSAFKFGGSYAGLRMALVAAAIPFDEITPQRWQKLLGCRSGGDKNVTKRRAQQLFPGVAVTHAIADALLIAECCRRLRVGQSADDPQPNLPTPRKARFVRRAKKGGLF